MADSNGSLAKSLGSALSRGISKRAAAISSRRRARRVASLNIWKAARTAAETALKLDLCLGVRLEFDIDCHGLNLGSRRYWHRDIDCIKTRR